MKLLVEIVNKGETYFTQGRIAFFLRKTVKKLQQKVSKILIFNSNVGSLLSFKVYMT